MAIVKLKYVRGKGSRDKIKAHLRYIVHRPGKEQEKLTRQLFSENYLLLDKSRAYDWINSAPGNTTFFKIIINFDAVKEDKYKDLDLHHLTSHTIHEMSAMMKKDVRFFATIHDDHTPLRHIHGICLVQGRIAKADFQKLKTLWQTATAEARTQRLRRDRAQERRHTRFLTQARVLSQSAPAQRRYRSARPLRIQHGCYHCGYGQLTGIPTWREYCPACRKPLNQEQTLSLNFTLQR